MSLLMAAGGAVGSQALESSFKSVNSASDYYFGGKKEKRSNRRSQSMTAQEKALDYKYDIMKMDHAYGLERKAYDYSNEEQYRLAEQYAINSALWQKESLKRAGLNPILAATNFSPNYGSTGSMSAPSTSFNGGHMSSAGGDWHSNAGRVDLLEGLRDLSSAKQATLATEIQEHTQPAVESTAQNTALRSAYEAMSARQQVDKIAAESLLTRAEAAKAEATARQIDSNTALNLTRAENEHDHGGVSSWPGLTATLLRALMPDFRSSNTARTMITRKIDDSVHTKLAVPYDDYKNSREEVPHVYPSIGPDGIKFVTPPKSLPSNLRKSILHTK